MSTNNVLNVGLSGATGTGNFIGATSPNFITPTLGAALATSINFGGSTLSTYVKSSSWTPVFTFSTSGDLSVSYATQSGTYSQIGNIIMVTFQLTFTPTFTTSSGIIEITGLPVTANASGGVALGNLISSTVAFTAGYTSIGCGVQPSTTYITFYECGSAQSVGQLGPAGTPTGVQYLIYGTATYLGV